jgi:hypothetical protein
MILEAWQIVHMRMLGNDNFLPYGSSMLEAARRIWRQLILIEDAMLVYRIVRSPERRVFKVDVGNIPPDQVDTFIEKVKGAMKRQQVVDPSTGRVDLRYNPLSVDEDYFIPVRGDRSSDISTLAGGQFTGDIDDVQYIQNKLFAALKIPKAYLSYEDAPASKANLAQLDVRFARTVGRIQRMIIAELNKIAIIHLVLLGYTGEDLVDFKLKLANSSIIAEQQYLELWRTRLEIASSAQEGVFDREFIWKRIFKLSDEEIDNIREGKKFDKIEDLYLEQVMLPGMDAGMGMEGEDGGEGDLPTTLGGEPGGAPPGGGEEAPSGGSEAPPPGGAVNAGMVPGGQMVAEQMTVCEHCKGGEPTDSCDVPCWKRKVSEKRNIGSTDPTGMKQAPFRKAPSPLKQASMTPQFHTRNGHKPSARDPMKVFKRIARGHVSAEDRKRHGIMMDHTGDIEDVARSILAEVKDIKKLT